MKTAVFVIPSAIGHLNPLIGIVRLLERSGLSVYVVARPFFRSTVESRKIGFIPNNYVEAICITEAPLEIKEKLKLWFKNFTQIFSYDKKIEFELQVRDFQRTISKLNPDVIFIDAQLTAIFVVLSHLPSKFISVDTMLSTKRSEFVPPLNRYLIPKKNLVFRGVIAWMWFENKAKKRFIHCIDYVIHFSQDKRKLLKSWMKSQSIKPKFELDYEVCYKPGIRGVAEVVLYPKELDYPWIKPIKERMHLSHFFRVPEEDLSEPFHSLVHRLPKGQERKILLCSFGTLSHIHNPTSIKFFQKLTAVMKQKPHWELVLSCGAFYDKMAEYLDVSPVNNVHLFRAVPQVQLLQYCDLFISHGGPNSIVESVVCNVPLLVYPLNSKWDHNGGAARVVYYKLGLKGNLSDNVSKILEDIGTIISDNRFRDAVKEMNSRINGSKSTDEELLSFLSIEIPEPSLQ